MTRPTPAEPVPTRTLGRTGLSVSAISVGTSAWGGQTSFHPAPVPERQAVDTALHAFRGPLRVIDTSNNYGDGECERRLGLAIREEGLPDGVLVQTKLDRDPVSGSFDAARMRASLAESLDRLGLATLPVLYLHDPETIGFDAAMAAGGPVETLRRMRDEGLAEHIGIAGGPVSMMLAFVETGIFDAMITHSRFTLVDRSATELTSTAREAGLGVFNAAVLGGGVLGAWPRRSDQYHYTAAHPLVLEAVDRMGAACERHDVPLIAAAQQFSTRDPRIDSTIIGMASPRHLDDTLANSTVDIPPALWEELDSLCPPASVWVAG
jgi:D-threo-aldose 1-dehydrogenase